MINCNPRDNESLYYDTADGQNLDTPVQFYLSADLSFKADMKKLYKTGSCRYICSMVFST